MNNPDLEWVCFRWIPVSVLQFSVCWSFYFCLVSVLYKMPSVYKFDHCILAFYLLVCKLIVYLMFVLQRLQGLLKWLLTFIQTWYELTVTICYVEMYHVMSDLNQIWFLFFLLIIAIWTNKRKNDFKKMIEKLFRKIISQDPTEWKWHHMVCFLSLNPCLYYRCIKKNNYCIILWTCKYKLTGEW